MDEIPPTASHSHAHSHAPLLPTAVSGGLPDQKELAHVIRGGVDERGVGYGNAIGKAHGRGIAPFTAVLWDLDGTISDSAAGIMSALAKTFDTLGLPVPDEDVLRSYVGPPILDVFREQGLDDAIEQEHAFELYREIVRDSGPAEDAHAYAGILDLVWAVHHAGVPQSTATSKPESIARRVLEAYAVADAFDFITGASDDERRSRKDEVVEEALLRLRGAGVDLSNVVMIGDRFYDVEGSAANGVPAIYVAWGYGAPGEERGAVATASTPAELRALLGV